MQPLRIRTTTAHNPPPRERGELPGPSIFAPIDPGRVFLPQIGNPMKTALALAALLLASPALAQQQPPSCGPRTKMIYDLANKYGEQPRFGAIDSHGGMLEVWGNEESHTWTLFVTPPPPAGTPPASEIVSCFIAAGKGFEFLPENAEPPNELKKDEPAVWSPYP